MVEIVSTTVCGAYQTDIFRRFADTSGQGFGMATLDGKLTYVNQPFCRILGEEKTEDALGKYFISYYREDVQQRLQDTILPAVLRGEQWLGELDIISVDGKAIPTVTNFFFIGDEDGKPLYYAGVFSDISDRRLLESQLTQAQKLEAVGQLAAGIAHEINTPTQYVGDNTRFLQDSFADLKTVVEKSRELLDALGDDSPPPPGQLMADVRDAFERADVDYLVEEIPQAIEQSLDGISRVSRIVGAMKAFSHPGSEAKTTVDLNKAIESTTTVCRNEWKYCADMELQLDAALPMVYCLPGDLNQVILNMVINAAHAIEENAGKDAEQKGTITLSTRGDGDWVEIRIADTGCGIPPDVSPKIFDLFFTTKQTGRGTGQGLSIVRDIIVKKHSGSIDFETEVGKGTTFIIRLPINPPPKTEEHDSRKDDTNAERQEANTVCR